ncbi:uncharacterized protein LOC116415702 [Nasonia vitripennis]|uniref:Uncharacterized protein n=1 Tax=Nasonia vitripennis TaxID=7425 RepID=A0A7M7J225_NASVI|nr:uncharacterized protein LOC116415702 [Nasonia vitripennis]
MLLIEVVLASVRSFGGTAVGTCRQAVSAYCLICCGAVYSGGVVASAVGVGIPSTVSRVLYCAGSTPLPRIARATVRSFPSSALHSDRSCGVGVFPCVVCEVASSIGRNESWRYP